MMVVTRIAPRTLALCLQWLLAPGVCFAGLTAESFLESGWVPFVGLALAACCIALSMRVQCPRCGRRLRVWGERSGVPRTCRDCGLDLATVHKPGTAPYR